MDLTQGTWQWLRSEYGDDSVVVVTDPTRYTIAFLPDGRVSIRNDCNQVAGTYTASGASSLTIQLGPTTLVACPPGSQSDIFTRDLSIVVTYVFSGENLVLNMRFDTGNMIFERQPVPSLTDTPWVVQSYNNGRGGVTTVLAQTEMTAQFGADGMVFGSAGCNTYRGSYTVSGTTLTVGPLATTRIACEPPIMEQENAFLAALQAGTQMTLAADRLTLRDAGGATQVIFVVAS